MKGKRISIETSVFHGRSVPEKGRIVGYGAIIESMELSVPMPNTLSLISEKNRKYSTERWEVYPPAYQPDENLYKQLVFAFKYEGINLLVLKTLYNKLDKIRIEEILRIEPTGQYSRRIWFLYEWLQKEQLNSPGDLRKSKYIPLLDDKLQFTIKGKESSRHKVINNLPGTIDFCPLIFKTDKLQKLVRANLADKKSDYLKTVHKDILLRASAFLLLKDSKASFTIEGESPKSKRTARWGQAIGQAGTKDLTKKELIRLQQLVIENTRFVDMGFRQKGGFVGEHDRISGEPIPNHISAKWQDMDQLIEGLLKTNDLLLQSDIDAVIAATIVAFGFVFIHPFEDGNGRIHRYLIHHLLAKKQFAQQGIIFPVSASILDYIGDYRKVLESYSLPLLDFISWKETRDHNVEVLNDTIDFYRYFDATKQAEYLYDCVNDTIKNIIPNEVKYLQRYDEFKRYLDDEFEMPDKLVATLVRFLEQNEGKLSKRARSKEFVELDENEIKQIENHYREIFLEE